jgi:hypothetical protein
VFGRRDARGLPEPADADLARRVEKATGAALPELDARAGPRAAARGRSVELPHGPQTPARELIVAHELAHAAEQTGAGASLSDAAAEAQADRVAIAAVTGRSHALAGFRRVAPALRSCGERDALLRALDAGATVSQADARKALIRYRGLAEADRASLFSRYYATGAISRFMASVAPADASGPFRDEVNDILRRIQEAATSGGAGLSEARMAQVQADWMRARDEAAARAASGSSAPPTSAQVEQAHRAEVEAQASIRPAAPVTRWGGLTPSQRASWVARGNAAVTRFVTFAGTRFPELRLTVAEIVVDIERVELRGANVQAFTANDSSGRPQAHVGFGWIELVEADPAYGASVIQHELRGHPQYDPFGATYPYRLYRRAATRAGYPTPAPGSPQEREDIDTFAYEDTEMYSLLLSAPYHTAVRPEHAALAQYQIDPESTVRWHIRQIRSQWEPRVATGILAGFYSRILADPRMPATSVDMYRRAVRAEVPPTEAGTILR